MEALINSCLVERIQSEKRFAALSKVLAKNLQRADAEFASRFDRIKLQRLLFESERIKTEFNLSNVQVVNDSKEMKEISDDNIGFTLEAFVS